MGAQACCVQKRLEFTIDCLGEHNSGGGGGASSSTSTAGNLWKGFSPPIASLSRDDDFAAEVAWQIATDRSQQVFEAATLLPVLYELKAPEQTDAYHTALAMHRKTEVIRQLATFQKPRGPSAQDRLRSFVASLQRLSDQTDKVVKVFEVFEDYLNLNLLTERCTGGNVYERILERQYFTEQESAMLVKHMLESLLVLHDQRLFHGNLTPASFGFLSHSPAAPMKLMDFGLELKIHWWDAVEHVEGGPDPRNPQFPQFFETCKLVFCAPEFAPPSNPPSRRRRTVPLSFCSDLDREVSVRHAANVTKETILDNELLADVIDEHADWLEEQQQGLAADYHKKFEAADVWSVGAMAFLLLCGYPPFFAPHRNAILSRIHRSEFSFDPPFWSKISEEGKDFVRTCLQESCWDRASVREALEHPWIRTLADTSPVGPMLSPFMLNLRRFYRTSLIEVFTANMLACSLPREDVQEFLRRCREIDQANAGFFTASDLKHVLTAMRHGEVAEAITQKFLRAFRHPGESYIDYVALLDSIFLRQQRLFREELWQQFQRVSKCTSPPGNQPADRLMTNEFGVLLKDPVVVDLLVREIPNSVARQMGSEASVCSFIENKMQQYCREQHSSYLDFHEISNLLMKSVRAYGASTETAAPAKGVSGAQAPSAQARSAAEAVSNENGADTLVTPEEPRSRHPGQHSDGEARSPGIMILASTPAPVSRVPARPQPAG